IYQLQLLPGVAHNDVAGLFQLRRVGRVLAQHEVVAEYHIQRRAQRLQNYGDEFIFTAARGFSHGAGRRFLLVRGDHLLLVALAVGNVAGKTAGMNEPPAFEERVGVDQDLTDRTGFAIHSGFAIEQRLAAGQAGEEVLNHRRVGVELGDMMADVFLVRVAEHEKFRPIGPEYKAVRSDHAEPFGRVFDEVAQVSYASK